jgi:hypothetical protein
VVALMYHAPHLHIFIHMKHRSRSERNRLEGAETQFSLGASSSVGYRVYLGGAVLAASAWLSLGTWQISNWDLWPIVTGLPSYILWLF